MAIDLPLETMSMRDKLSLLESIWESLRQEPDLPTPEWHRDLLAERTRRLESGAATILDWEDVKESFRTLGNQDAD